MGTHEAEMDALEDFESFIDGKRSALNKPNPGLFYIPGKPQVGGGKTLNFIRMGHALYWLWAMFFGTQDEKMEADHLIMNDLQQEKIIGHMSSPATTEQMAADPHYNFWLYPMVLLLKAADMLKRPLDYTAFQEWICRNFHVEAAISSQRDEEVCGPGARFKQRDGNDFWSVRTVANREFNNMPHHGNAKDPNDPIWHTYRDYACCRVLRKYNIKDLEWNGDLQVKLKLPMIVHRFERGYLAYIDKPHVLPKLEDEFCDWVIFDESTGKCIDLGKDWQQTIPVEQLSLGKMIGQFKKEIRIG